jgi:cytochrome c biogenesis protein CcmG, thiol:disulfide interchange protein DsbE
VAAIAAIAVAVGIGVLLLTRGGDRQGVAHVGAAAPAVDLADVRPDRPRVVLASFRGTPVLVNFWATWCDPCRTELPLFAAADARLHGKVAIVGVDVRDNRAAAARFLAARRARYPSAYDPEAVTRRPFSYVGLPVTVLVGRDGRVLERVTGAVSRSRLDGLIRRAQATE